MKAIPLTAEEFLIDCRRGLENLAKKKPAYADFVRQVFELNPALNSLKGESPISIQLPRASSGLGNAS